MSDDSFSGLIRSGTSHSVSVSERTGNAKTPKNIVQSEADKAAAKKIEFEKQIAASNDAKKALAADLAQHDENVAGGVALDLNIQSVEASSLELNTQKLAPDKAANQNRQSIDADASSKANIQGIKKDNVDVNLQAIGSDNIAANLQNIPLANGIEKNVQGVVSDAITTNKQSVGSGSISTNLQGVNSDGLNETNQNVGHGNIAANMQNIPNGKSIASNVQEIPVGGIAANQQKITQAHSTSHTQSLTEDKSSPNNQGVSSRANVENHQAILNAVPDGNDEKTAKLTTKDNSQRLGENTPDRNNQPVGTTAASLNIQGAAEDGPLGSNRQPIDKENLKDHYEALPSGNIERKKVEFASTSTQSSVDLQQVLSNGVVNKQGLSTSVEFPLTAQQAAKLKHDKFADTFQGRLAGIKRNNDSLHSKLDAIEKL